MKQNIIQSIIRRGLSFVLLSLLMPIGAWGQDYAIRVAGVDVTSQNADGVTGEGIHGSVTYDAAQGALILDDATITGNIVATGGTALKIKVKGENVINAGTSSAIQAITEPNFIDLEFIKEGTGDCSLQLNSTDVTVISTYFNTPTYTNLALVVDGVDDPSYDYQFNGLSYYDSQSQSTLPVTSATITSYTSYDITVGDIAVTSLNADDILGSGHEGSMSFDAANNILTVNNVGELPFGIKSGLDALTIKVSGVNTIYSESGAAISYNGGGGGTLTFVKDADADLSSLTLTSYANNVSTNEPYKAIEGFALDNITISDPLRLTSPTSMSDILNVTTVSIANYNEAYKISIAGTTVTDLNKGDVLGDGKVSFTVIEGQVPTNTLTLNGVTLTQPIKVGLANLTIDIQGTNSITTEEKCIQMMENTTPAVTFTSTSTKDSNLTLKGTDGVNSVGEYNVGSFTITDKLALVLKKDGYTYSNQYLFTDGSTKEAILSTSYGVTVGSMQICADNAADVIGEGIGDGDERGSGMVSFNKETSTLTLTNASLSGIIRSSLPNLTIDLVGNNSIYSDDSHALQAGSAVNMTITSSGIVKGSFSMRNRISDFVDDNVDLDIDDASSLSVIYGSLENNTGNDNSATIGVSYGITITNAAGSYPITSVNRKNVLNNSEGEESVQFDGQNTLILTNANINKISISADPTLTNGLLKIYLIGDNTIGSQANDGLVNQGTNNMHLLFATSDLEPGTLALSYAQPAQPLVGFVPTFLNNLTDMMNPDQQQITIAVSMEPFVTQNGEEKTEDGGGVGLGKDIEYAETSILQAGILVNKILYTLPDFYDGYWLEDSKKLVAINSSMTDADANAIMAAVIDGSLLPGTSDFAQVFHGMTFLLPAGSGDIVLDVNTNQSGELHVKVGNNDPVFISGTTGFEERRVPYALTEESYVFLYSVAPVVSSSRFRAPGRKMANTTTLKSVKVSARSVAATPPPVLMPKVLTKDDVAAAKSGNHITITDTDVTDYADNAFEGQTGITYVDLSATSITGKIIDRTKLPKSPADAIVFLPASNDDNLAKNIVIAGVCNDLQLNDAVDFEIPSDFTAVKASLSRNFTSDLGKNCTVCVPFALDDTQAAELGTFYTLSAHSGNTITMESVDATETNKAYMFKPAKETFSAEMVDVKKADPVRTTVSELSFLGTYQKITGLNSTADIVYYCFMQDGPQAGKFVKITDAVTVNPFRAYMELPASESLARVLDLNFGEGGATGIGGLTPNPSPIGEGNVGFYDLQGRRVLYPKKGLYILNGKKVIIK